MNNKKELLRVRITLTAGILALIAILALVFLKFPDNTDARFVYETNKDGKLLSSDTQVTSKNSQYPLK